MSEGYTSHLFAVGRWPEKHPCRFLMGKPVEVWCLSLYDSSINCLVPISCIAGRTIVATEVVNGENVLIVIPLVD